MQTYLSVFEYFMFWTAFYVLRGGRSIRESAASGVGAGGGRSAGGGGLGLLGQAAHWGGLPSADQLVSDIKRMGSTLITGACMHGQACWFKSARHHGRVGATCIAGACMDA